MDLSCATWRKASRSNSNGGNCVEVATWRKASRSNSNGGDCVEVASHRPEVVAVRDSKDPDGPKLAFSPAGWERFTACVRGSAFDVN
jgi:hypothetical protein